MPFSFQPQAIAGVVLVQPQIFQDERGYFLETFKAAEYRENGIEVDFLQDNYSYSAANVLRGLHFQTNPKAQGKLIQVMQGRIFDVAVDLRLGSPTYKQWLHVVLDDVQHNLLWIPPGVAHGFCVLSPTANIIYKCSEYYSPVTERAIHWNDPELNIAWPVKEPLISPKDAANKPLSDLSETDLLRFAP
jgi:dTDP-4-dehydrorhamnose 3,5-epimerase